MIKRKFWKPAVTSQFDVCPVPFHMDTYRGCTYGCLYCFARDFIAYARRNSEHNSQCYLEGNRADLFGNWIQRVNAKEYDYNHAEEVAFKQRIPLKIGATADPFPFIQKNEKITFDVLKILQKIDYPVQISTKNPEIFLSYSDEFRGANIALSVTISTNNQKFSELLQKGAISIQRRFSAIQKLAQKGYKVFVRIQPFIYHDIMNNLQDFIKRISDSGAYGFITQGLKIRTILNKKQQLIYNSIGKPFNINYYQWMKNNGQKTHSDYEYSNTIKKQVLSAMDNLAIKYNLKFYSGDNYMGHCYGCSGECCGTEVLRDYRINGLAERIKKFGTKTPIAEHLPKCQLNFTRNRAIKNLTIEKAVKSKQLEYIQGYLFQDMD